jgi:hypothetical protein
LDARMQALKDNCQPWEFDSNLIPSKWDNCNSSMMDQSTYPNMIVENH